MLWMIEFTEVTKRENVEEIIENLAEHRQLITENLSQSLKVLNCSGKVARIPVSVLSSLCHLIVLENSGYHLPHEPPALRNVLAQLARLWLPRLQVHRPRDPSYLALFAHKLCRGVRLP